MNPSRLRYRASIYLNRGGFMVPAHAANNCLISDYCLNYQAISGSSTLKAEEHDHAKGPFGSQDRKYIGIGKP
jgi:hypothetical protein